MKTFFIQTYKKTFASKRFTNFCKRLEIWYYLSLQPKLGIKNWANIETFMDIQNPNSKSICHYEITVFVFKPGFTISCNCKNNHILSSSLYDPEFAGVYTLNSVTKNLFPDTGHFGLCLRIILRLFFSHAGHIHLHITWYRKHHPKWQAN